MTCLMAQPSPSVDVLRAQHSPRRFFHRCLRTRCDATMHGASRPSRALPRASAPRAQPLPRAARVLSITRPPHWPVREPLCRVLRVGALRPVGVSKNFTTFSRLWAAPGERASAVADACSPQALSCASARLERSPLRCVLRTGACPRLLGAPLSEKRAFLPRPSNVPRHSELGCSQSSSESSLGPLIGNRRSRETAVARWCHPAHYISRCSIPKQPPVCLACAHHSCAVQPSAG